VGQETTDGEVLWGGGLSKVTPYGGGPSVKIAVGDVVSKPLKWGVLSTKPRTGRTNHYSYEWQVGLFGHGFRQRFVGEFGPLVDRGETRFPRFQGKCATGKGEIRKWERGDGGGVGGEWIKGLDNRK